MKPDSVQIVASVTSTGGFLLANYDRLAAAACALVGLAYTLWKWRREARRRDR